MTTALTNGYTGKTGGNCFIKTLSQQNKENKRPKFTRWISLRSSKKNHGCDSNSSPQQPKAYTGFEVAAMFQRRRNGKPLCHRLGSLGFDTRLPVHANVHNMNELYECSIIVPKLTSEWDCRMYNMLAVMRCVCCRL